MTAYMFALCQFVRLDMEWTQSPNYEFSQVKVIFILTSL